MDQPLKLYEICILQPEQVNPGLDRYQPQIEAVETEEGLNLYECELMPEDSPEGDMDITDWGTLSLEGWQALCEMFALRHGERFARVVEKWHEWKVRSASNSAGR